MNINEYQSFTRQTAVYDERHSIYYLGLGLAGEAGEVANKIKKIIRDNHGEISPELRRALADEMGDVYWYLSELATVLGFQSSEILNNNIVKLSSRIDRKVIHGDGDNR